jgi:hypothetical protein
MNLNDEIELIVKMPFELSKDLEIASKQFGYKNSREMFARFVKRQLSIYFDIDENSDKLINIR